MIELGELAIDDDQRVAGLRFAPWTRPALRAMFVLLVAVVGLGASAPTLAPIAGPLWTAPLSGDFFGIGERLVYHSEGGESVVARDPESGEVKWRQTIGGTPQNFNEFGSVVALQRTYSQEQGSLGVLVEIETGAALADFRGYALGRVGNRIVSVADRRSAFAGECDNDPYACMEILALDYPTGATAWMVSLEPGMRLAISIVEGVVDGIATSAATGEVRLIDVGTGRVVRSAIVPGGADQVQPMLTTDLLVTVSTGGEQRLVRAFDRSTLQQRWELAVPTAEGDNPGQVIVHKCADFICLVQNLSTRVLDPASGTLRATIADGWALPVAAPAGTLFTTPTARFGDTVGSADLTSTLNGSKIATFVRSTVVDWRASGGRALVLQHLREYANLIVVSALGQSKLIGRLPGKALRCQAYATSLACTTLGGGLGLWRLAV